MRTTPGKHELRLPSRSPSPHQELGSPLALGVNESWSTPVSSPLPGEAELRSPWYEIRREEAEELLPPSVVILCAREEEAQHMRGWLEGPVLHESKLAGQWRRSSGQLKGVSVRVDLVVCGVGATNAAAAAASACCIGESHRSRSPVAVFNVGRAVGHESELFTGDVVVGTHTIGLDIETHADCRSPSPGAPSPHSDDDPCAERHRSVRRVDTEYGLLEAARVAAATQRVGVVVEGVVGSTEAWATASPSFPSAPGGSTTSRLHELVTQHNSQNDSHLDDIAVTDGEAHSAAVVCRRWAVPFVTIKEVLAPNPTESSRRAAGGRAAEMAVRILRLYKPIESNAGSSRGTFCAAELSVGPDPLTPPVAATVSRLLKPKPLRFEGGAVPQALLLHQPSAGSDAASEGYAGGEPRHPAQSTSAADGVSGGGGGGGGASEIGGAAREAAVFKRQQQGGTGDTAGSAGRGGSDSYRAASPRGSDSSGAGEPRASRGWQGCMGCMGSWGGAAVSVSVVAALALGCSIGLYLARQFPAGLGEMSIATPTAVFDSSAARAAAVNGAIAACNK